MRDGHVFLNVPFDARYERLFLALIAGLVGLGLTPHTVLEIPAQRDRLRRIWSLIRSCRYSLHDLSRVQLSSGTVRVPRFNMPFEAGLAIAFALGGRHQWRVLEERDYRLQQSLSDLNGFEPLIHGGTPTGVLERLMDAFVRIPVELVELHDLYRTLVAYRQTYIGDRMWEPRPFRMLVRTAIARRRALRAS